MSKLHLTKGKTNLLLFFLFSMSQGRVKIIVTLKKNLKK